MRHRKYVQGLMENAIKKNYNGWIMIFSFEYAGKVMNDLYIFFELNHIICCLNNEEQEFSQQGLSRSLNNKKKLLYWSNNLSLNFFDR